MTHAMAPKRERTPNTISVIVNGAFFSTGKYEFKVPRRSRSPVDVTNVYDPLNVVGALKSPASAKDWSIIDFWRKLSRLLCEADVSPSTSRGGSLVSLTHVYLLP